MKLDAHIKVDISNVQVVHLYHLVVLNVVNHLVIIIKQVDYALEMGIIVVLREILQVEICDNAKIRDLNFRVVVTALITVNVNEAEVEIVVKDFKIEEVSFKNYVQKITSITNNFVEDDVIDDDF